MFMETLIFKAADYFPSSFHAFRDIDQKLAQRPKCEVDLKQLTVENSAPNMFCT